MRLGYKISSIDGKFQDMVFDDWFQLCAYLMGTKSRVTFKPFSVDIVFIVDGER